MKQTSFRLILTLAMLFAAVCTSLPQFRSGDSGSGPRFSVSFPADLHSEPVDGRLLLLISNDPDGEPRFQISDGARSQLVFGIDIEGLHPGETADIDGSAFGYPLPSIADIPAGRYTVQALIHLYETFHRSDGHVVKLPMDRGEGQHWNRAPGNLYSTPAEIDYDPLGGEITLTLDRVIPPVTPPEDTRYIKHIQIKSRLLSEFWGRPMYIGAHVLLPYGYEEHPEARYPLMINHDHFSPDFRGFSETPPAPDGDRRMRRFQEYAYRNYLDWIAPDTPRMIVIKPLHPCPYYDDSYAVNSENVGPYGDAITYELVPYIEKQFRCLGTPWARFLYGGSTGGWSALGVQVFYPDQYNGCWAGCPDGVDFRAYQIVNIYENENAYFLESPWKKTERPGQRTPLGEVLSTVREQNHRELALGTRSRSGGQWDIWEAVYSPAGPDGYPARIWDKLTGEIDHEVAAYWKEHYDLRYILERDWKTIGPSLTGKIHVSVGDMDSFHLNNAVYLLEEFLESTTDPYYAGTIHYGDREPHCWSGEMVHPKTGEEMSYHAWHALQMEKRALESATAACDTVSWRY
ncbi:hypothetical protein JXO52_17895 [bacterium]|nr:hypothetical protein [bacterium]